MIENSKIILKILTSLNKSQLTELIEDSRLDGYNINREGNVVSTNRTIIHYSKNGYHIVPTLREFKELRR